MNNPDALTLEACTFCNILVEPPTAFDVGEPIDQGAVTLVPSLGMIMPGYLLALTAEHVTSFAQLPPNRLSEVDASLTEVEDQLAPLFGNYFRIEHGSDNLSQCGSGGCMDHAHLHLIAADDDVGVHILNQLPWQQIDAYEDVADFQGEPYIYLGRLAAHYVVPNPNLPGQWARRQIAEVRQLENFDWAIDYDEAKLSETFMKLRTLTSSFANFRDHPLVIEHLAAHPPTVTQAEEQAVSKAV